MPLRAGGVPDGYTVPELVSTGGEGSPGATTRSLVTPLEVLQLQRGSACWVGVAAAPERASESPRAPAQPRGTTDSGSANRRVHVAGGNPVQKH